MKHIIDEMAEYEHEYCDIIKFYVEGKEME